VQITFPPATAENPRVEYRLEVTAIYPELPGRNGDPRLDGFKRDFLNIFQVNPRMQMLANNSSSDPCAFTVFEYAEMARRAPPLARGLNCLDLIRMTLDRYLAGVKGYGQVGFGCTPGPCRLEHALDLARLVSVAADRRVPLHRRVPGLGLGWRALR
jgi:hypothetical protein